jgi:hypothetical protein
VGQSRFGALQKRTTAAGRSRPGAIQKCTAAAGRSRVWLAWWRIALGGAVVDPQPTWPELYLGTDPGMGAYLGCGEDYGQVPQPGSLRGGRAQMHSCMGSGEDYVRIHSLGRYWVGELRCTYVGCGEET